MSGFANMIFANSTPPAGGVAVDPFWDNVLLLVKADGTNGSTSIVDSSKFNRSITRAGDAQISTAESKFGGSSLFLDGTGDWCDIPDSDDWAFSGPFTIETWYYPLDSGQDDGIISHWPGVSATNVAFIFRKAATNRLQFTYGIGTTNANVTGSDQTLNINAWNHVAVTRDNSNVIRMFVNGVADATTATVIGTLNNSTSAVRIGGITDGNGAVLRGYLDDLRVTGGVARYTANFTPPTEEFPVTPTEPSSGDEYWTSVGLLLKGENTAGTYTFTDLSNNNYTIDRLKTSTTATDVVNSSAQSKFGSGSIFVPKPTNNSNGDYILINKSSTTITQPNARIGTNNDWTYEMWYWPISGSPTQRGISGYGFFAFNAALTSSGFTETSFSNTSAGTTTTQHTKISPTAITFNAWNHLAWTRSGTTMYHFLNGVTQWTQAFTGTLRTFRTVDAYDYGFAIGHRHAGGATGAFSADSHAWGYLDEIRVTQNVARYTANFTPPTATFPTTA